MTVSPGLPLEKSRISSIDLVRGIVMVIMALDHVRDFFHVSAFVFDPADPGQTSPLLFFTRWITHFCAPTFVLLSGTGIRLSLQRKSKKELSRFLWTRGLWLILLEFTFVRFSFFFNLYYDMTIVQVIYTIGISMIFMAALIHLKPSLLLALGLVITLGHNLLDPIQLEPGHPLYFVWSFIHQADMLQIAPGKYFFMRYPFLPWLGIMLLGYGLGGWYGKDVDPLRRRTWLLRTGVSVTLAFITLRLLNVYGDPSPWTVQVRGGIYTFLSFLNCTKYPPSLLYSLMTLGPVLITLALLETVRMPALRPFTVFGRVPMFYYLFHFYLIHTLSILAFIVVRHKGFADMNFYFIDGRPTGFFGGVPFSAGYDLPWVYVIWMAVILLCYPVCRWYNRYKSTHDHWWLSYL
jgi:uncharacterized membrane protein